MSSNDASLQYHSEQKIQFFVSSIRTLTRCETNFRAPKKYVIQLLFIKSTKVISKKLTFEKMSLIWKWDEIFKHIFSALTNVNINFFSLTRVKYRLLWSPFFMASQLTVVSRDFVLLQCQKCEGLFEITRENSFF